MIRHILHLAIDTCCRAVALATLPGIPTAPQTALRVPVYVAGHGPDSGRRSSYVARSPSGHTTNSPETAHRIRSGYRWRLDMTADASGRTTHER